MCRSVTQNDVAFEHELWKMPPSLQPDCCLRERKRREREGERERERERV